VTLSWPGFCGTEGEEPEQEGSMKGLLLSLALLLLSLSLSVPVGPAGSAALHGSPAAAGKVRCVKGLISVEGVSDQQAILFVQDGFSCKPA
jgi:hypothetical protein